MPDDPKAFSGELNRGEVNEPDEHDIVEHLYQDFTNEFVELEVMRDQLEKDLHPDILEPILAKGVCDRCPAIGQTELKKVTDNAKEVSE